jgi:hypothetical protein
MSLETTTHSQIPLGGQPRNVSRDYRGTLFVGDETLGAFREKRNLLGRDKPKTTAWSLHRTREREAARSGLLSKAGRLYR